MGDDHIDPRDYDGQTVVFRGQPFRVVINPHPEIEISEDMLHYRDGLKSPAQGDQVQVCVDSRGRHSATIGADEKGTTKYRDHEVVDVTETTSPNGERRRRYTLRYKEAQ